jgi:GT2 family glycosyltransferase
MNEDGTEQAGGRRKIPTPELAFVRATGLSRLFPRRFNDFTLHLEPLPETPAEVEAISGACMLARRAAIADVGPIDEGYFLRCEDLDWCMRFLQCEWKILFVPDVTAIHRKGGACRSPERDRSRLRPSSAPWRARPEQASR